MNSGNNYYRESIDFLKKSDIILITTECAWIVDMAFSNLLCHEERGVIPHSENGAVIESPL